MAACLLIWLPRHALALDPSRSLVQYNCQTWSRQNGLLVNGVDAITQSRDGYLWLGTSVGLIRFDGNGFTTIHLPQPGNRTVVTSLANTGNDELWVGWEHHGFNRYDEQFPSARGKLSPSPPDANLLSLQEDADGTQWVTGDHQWGRVKPGGKYEVLAAIPDPSATCGFKDSQGRFWAGTAYHGVSYWQAGVVHGVFAAELEGSIIFAFAEDHEGNLWIGTSSGLFSYDAHLKRRNINSLAAEISVLMVDRQGVLWIGTSHEGLARYYHDRYDYFKKSDGLASYYVNALFEDREGSLWVGTRNGVSLLTDVKFPTCLLSDKPSDQDALSVCASRKGGVWVGSMAGLTYLGDQPTTYGMESGLPNPIVKRVLETRTGDLYLVCGNESLAVFSSNKVVAIQSETNMVVGMVEDDQGVVVSVGGDLFRANKNHLTPFPFANHLAPPMYWVLNLALGRDGVIWVASVNGITRIKDGAFQQWTKAQGLTDSRIGWICEDSEGVVWAATATGIARLKDNQIRCISEDDGLFDNHVLALVPDDLGNLWVNARRGVFRVSRQSLNDFADGRKAKVECTPFDGLASVKPADNTYQEQVGCKSLDGRIWFPCANGALVINPRQIPINTLSPLVRIQSIRANGHEYPRRPSLVVPPGNGELEFDFAALSFIAPQQVRVRYQLAGVDPQWVDAGPRRLAFYTNLKPGPYIFHVIAANADGVWNQTGDTLRIELRPHFYQTVWFYAGGAGLLAGVLIGAYRRYLRRIEQKERALQEGRDRLAREVDLRTAELAQERDLLRILLDNAPDHIYFKDTQSRFVKSGKAQARQFGVASADDLLGKSDTDFFSEEHARPAFEDEQRIMRTGEPMIGKIERETWGDGRPDSWVLTSKMPYRNPAGEIIGTFGISKNITALKQTETELAYERDLLKALLDNCPDSIYFKDRQSRFVRVSKSKLERDFSLSLQRHQATAGSENLPIHLTSLEEFKKYYLGRTDSEFFPEDIAQALYAEEQEIIRTGTPLIGKLGKYTWLDGSVVWFLATKMLWRGKDGEILGTFGLSKDITFLKLAEAQVEEAHKRLLETSRQAGMAEVATNVLHNVGNVLNSVNVSAALVADNARRSTVSYVGKVAALLQEHAADLGTFMTTDPKGTQLPAFLGQLAAKLAGEQQQAVTELELLRHNIEHIKDIVAMQQSYAKISGLTDTVKVCELVEDALAMNTGALTRHGVELARDYAEVPPITVEKHKVLQILVNLIRNAKYACDDAGRKDKKITIQIAPADQGVRITVRDNGIGIPPENLTLIFNHGFTTRKGGHGFGLHSGALAARELGGSLSVHSDGTGHGAAFTLELPLLVDPSSQNSGPP